MRAGATLAMPTMTGDGRPYYGKWCGSIPAGLRESERGNVRGSDAAFV
jgi:hypothetical protein